MESKSKYDGQVVGFGLLFIGLMLGLILFGLLSS